MKYWWVNHKKTVKEEIEKGYLWSPVRKTKGTRNIFYDNMKEATPGDPVLSFASGRIRYIGRVSDFAISSPIPPSFESAGMNWNKDGWLLPVRWKQISAVRPKDIIREIKDLLPQKYSPLNPKSGDGNQGAYLAEISYALFNKLAGSADDGAAHGDIHHEAASIEWMEFVGREMEVQVNNDTSLDDTTKRAVIQARRGQGKFRSNVFQYEDRCRLTQIVNEQLLIASHIKPWRACQTAAERLDGANGLLLTPHVDRLFDRGFISFNDNGTVLVSKRITPKELESLGLATACQEGTPPLHPEQMKYMGFHRMNVFLT
jgi:putative restriction endonuclease